MGTTTRTIGRLLFIALLIAAVIGAMGFILVRRSWPQLEGNLEVAGLRQPVEVLRDAQGVPHIYASTEQDLFFAQGYVHAQDRFWQMDYWRHIGSGSVAELLGADQLDVDRFLRTLGWGQLATQEFEAADETTQAALLAYTDGVNAYLSQNRGAALSFEYAILKLTNWGYEPEPWTPENSITWGKVMAWLLRSNLDTEIERAMLLTDMSPQEVDQLYPPYPPGHPVIVGGSGVQGPTAAAPTADVGALMSVVSNRASQLDVLVGEGGSQVGSNNWAISGDMTESGMPILANDPHLPVQIPSIWYEVGLHCVPVGLACGVEAMGFSFAGVPGVILGHNGHIAWGATTAVHDVMDLYIEKLNPDNPNQYEFRGEWVDMEVRTEMLEAPGRDPVELAIRSTHHGPIISDVFEDLEDFNLRAGVRVPEHYAISLSWTALQPTGVVDTFMGLNRATNWDEFRTSLSSFLVPGQNFVYADKDGNVGYQSTGIVPIRAAGDGTVPVPGWTGEYEWTGFVLFDQLPRSFNPSEGFVFTANNRPAGGDYPHTLSQMWAYGYRAQRIADMLEAAPGPIDPTYARLMQGDARDLFAEVLVPYLRDVVPNSDLARHGQALLGEWGASGSDTFDATYQMRPDSAAAAVYASVWARLLTISVADELGGEYAPEGGSRWFQVMTDLLEDPEHPWWDYQFTEDIETRDQILLQALEEGMAETASRLGGDPRTWTWGALHTVTFENQSLGQSGIAPIEWLFNRGSYGTGGSASVPNATAWDASEDFTVAAHPSMRMVVDFSDLDTSTWIHSTGQSGHTFHPNYVDMAQDWADVRTHPMPWSREAVEAVTTHRLMLTPEV